MQYSRLGRVAALLLVLGAPAAHAGYVVTFTESGSDVVATGSGTIDTTDLTALGNTANNSMVFPDSSYGSLEFTGYVAAGNQSDNVTLFVAASGPEVFGTGDETAASSGTGDLVGIDAQNATSALYLPIGYVSGAALSSSSTWDNASFASLGLTPGTYVYTWGAGADADSYTVQIGQAIPEPMAGLVFAVPLGLLALWRRRIV